MTLEDCSPYNIQSAGGTSFVHDWIHSGLRQLGEHKTSRSSGKLVTVSDALAKCSANGLWLGVPNSQYRIGKMKLSCVC